MSEKHEFYGTARLYVDETPIAEREIRTIAAMYSLCGEGLCVGYDSGDPVSGLYPPRFEFTGGTISRVVYDIGDDLYVDFEQQFAAAMARD
jgi:arylsulfatase